MAFCPNCGSAVEGTFCAKCGAAVGAGGPASGAGAAPGYGPTPGYQAPPPGASAGATTGGMTDNMASALCYLLGILTGIIFLVLAPYNQNRTVRFHAFQSIFFGIGIFVAWIALLIFSIVLHVLPVVGTIISLLLYLAFSLGIFILWIMLMYRAYNKETWVLPVVGPLAQKQA
ncbi:MAG TPA: hypothetical protein VKV15_24185 [Bryobacteraceae bacterium]|nr:hypothetical protein [Bryobacteraceae bacterium]